MKSTMGKRSGSSGFTLVELMIVVAIVTILAMIAIPSYTSQMRKSRRTEARTALLDLAAREERFFSTNSAYTNTPASLGYVALPQNVGNNYYQIDVPAASATAFTATATPINDQVNDTSCGTFSIDNTGTQSVTGAAGIATCWN